jgi:D-alanyl-D-alanine carboxypeptidase (penicillin-binding protein 5/6)
LILLAVALVSATVALQQTRRESSQTVTGPDAQVQAADLAAGLVSASGEKGQPGVPAGAAVGRTEAGRAAPVDPAWGSSASVAPTEGFLRAGQPGVDYTAAYVVDRGTGRVLYEHNAHTPVPTASMAKMMTSLIVMEEIGAGRLTLEDPVTISARASTMGGSQIYAREGQTFPVETLLAATMVQSANDAATALAEKVAGSTEAFAELMNRRARELGLEGSTFYDPHGLPAENGRENRMTARDLAVVGNALLRYPLMQEYSKAATLPFQNATFTSGMTNPNHLLRNYDGAYGIKTGYTASAGFSVTAAARRRDTDVITVLTGAKSSRGPNSSFGLAGRLMDEVFLSWSTVVPVREGAPAGEVSVKGGTPRKVEAVAARDVTALVPRGDENTVSWRMEQHPVRAPLEKGDTVGSIVVLQNDAEVARVPALAAENVQSRPWWRFWGG